MPPVVSVLMPVYNAQRYVASAVRSILTQDFTEFELIIIDDGSTDRSSSILRQLAEQDARIRLISRPNTGLVKALNEGLEMAQGEFIARMDADDLSLPQRFGRQVEFLRAHPECVLIGSSVTTMDQDGAMIGVMPDITFGHERIDRALLCRGWPIVHPTVMMRANALRQVGAYRSNTFPNEDHDLFLRLAEVGKLENLPEVLLYYRKHMQSISAQNLQRMTQNVGYVIVAACRRRGIPVPPEVAQYECRPDTQASLCRKWAWQAMKNKNIRTARKYALATLWRRPLSLQSWRLTYCAVRGW